MAKINGTSFLLLLDGTALGSSRTASISFSVEAPDTTTKDSGGWAENLAGGGLRSAEGSFEGLEDATDTYNVNELFDLINTRADFDFQLTDSQAGTDIWTGTATITNLEINYEMEQPVSISGSFRVNGQPSRTTET